MRMRRRLMEEEAHEEAPMEGEAQTLRRRLPRRRSIVGGSRGRADSEEEAPEEEQTLWRRLSRRSRL